MDRNEIPAGVGRAHVARGLSLADALFLAAVACFCMSGCAFLSQLLPHGTPPPTHGPTPETPEPTAAQPTPAPTPTPTATTPSVKPTPDSCPVLVKIGIGPLGNPFRDGAGRPCQWLDSTPRFAGKFCPRADGCACNSEHHEVCSIDGKGDGEYRHCEPASDDALVITAVSGARAIFAPAKRAEDPVNVRRGYQIAVCGPLGSQYVVKIDLAVGAMGADGKPISKIFGFEPGQAKGTYK